MTLSRTANPASFRAVTAGRRDPRARLGTAAAEYYGGAPGHSFEFGLQAILDGLEARLSAGGTPAARNARPPVHDDREPAPGQ